MAWEKSGLIVQSRNEGKLSSCILVGNSLIFTYICNQGFTVHTLEFTLAIVIWQTYPVLTACK
jgi:hypothetical protein